MYHLSEAKEKIESLITYNKLLENEIFQIREEIYPGAKNKNIIITRKNYEVTLDIMSIIYNDDFIRIHFELDDYFDNELIVDLRNFALILRELSQEVVERTGGNRSYFQFKFENLEAFNKFFNQIVWPNITKTDEIF